VKIERKTERGKKNRELDSRYGRKKKMDRDRFDFSDLIAWSSFEGG
jgi:hypothetical protein